MRWWPTLCGCYDPLWGARLEVVGEVWPLVGREAQLARLGELLACADARSVVVTGPAGVGKTRLVAACVDLGVAAGLTTFRVAGTKASASVPLGAFAPLLVGRDGGVAGDVAHRADLFRNCIAALLARAGEHRLMVVVDDAHELDDVSAALVHQIAVSGTAFVVVAVRTGERAPEPIVALWKDDIAERIEVTGLEMSAVDELLRTVLGGIVESSTVTRLTARSEGNVLFLRELVSGALADGALRCDGGVWRLVADLFPSERLGELVEARLGILDLRETALLELVAVGEPLDMGIVETLSDAAVAEALERKALVSIDMTGGPLKLRLAHPLYGDVLRTRMPRLRLMRMAGALARTVEASGPCRGDDVLRVGCWYLLAGGGDPDVLLRAARQARARFDAGLAERLARAAHQAGAGFDAALLAAQMAVRQGRGEAAEAELAALAEIAPDDDRRRAVAITRVENCFWYRCRWDDTRRLAEEAKGRLTEGGRQEIDLVLASHIVTMEGFTAGTAALEPFVHSRRADLRQWASVLYAYCLLRLGRLDAAIAISDAYTADGASTEPVGPYRIWHFVMDRCQALAHAGQLEAAEAAALDQYRQSLAERSTERQGMFAWMLARMVAERGRVATAIRYGREAVTLQGDIGRHQSQHDAMNNLALALALGGCPDDAAAVFDEQDTLRVPPPVHTEVERLQAHAWVAVARNDLPTARRLLHEAAQHGARIGDHVGEAAALHDIARLGHAQEVSDRLNALTSLLDGELVVARAAHVAALARRDGAQLERVSTEFDKMGARLFAAEAAADAAVIWRSSGHTRRSLAAARRALMLTERCEGAITPALQTIDARARLTAAERDTALLAALGHSNKTIADQLGLSVRTVENRLHRIYEKLGISARADLATALGQP